MDILITSPVIISINSIISTHKTLLTSYLFRIFTTLRVVNPIRLFRSIIFQQIIGIEYQSHYSKIYPEIKTHFSKHFQLYGADKIKENVSKITNSMAAWKLILFQAFLLRKCYPALLNVSEEKTADIDVSTLQSSSSKKEGAEIGYNKKCKGKPCFQLSATFIGRVFTDARLFSGHCNPTIFFQKAVKRIISLGFDVKIIRADSAYLSHENLFFLKKFSLGYAIGAPATFAVVKKGRKIFKTLARKKSSLIIPVAKGISIYDLGQVVFANNVQSRIIIVRRIGRKKTEKLANGR